MRSIGRTVKNARFSPLEIAILITLAAFLYTLMEWLFVISKTSFLSSSAFLQKLLILINSSSLLSLLAAVILVPLLLLFVFLRGKVLRSILRFLLCLIPASIMATLLLLLVDNITYSIWDFGVVSTKNTVRALYLAGFILLSLALTIPVFRIAHSIERSRRKTSAKSRLWFPLILGAIVLLCAILPMVFNSGISTLQTSAALDPKTLPNIILVTGDALNSVKLSLYGSNKDTTPFLKELGETSLVAENAFSNAQGTIGSTTSILTGKYPTDTRILAASDILEGEDALQHLPGILKSYGYYTVQLSFSYYGDAYRINFQEAFDMANGETPIKNPLQSKLAKALPTDYYYFIREEYTRVSDRLGHLFYIKEMTNPFLQVTEAPEKFNDQQKLDALFKLLDEGKTPVFVNIHWMGTHGPKYYPDQQVFSAGKDMKTQGKYVEDFYFDSILQFDGAIAKIVEGLKERDLFDRTVLVVGSDHTQRWSIARIPLLFHFPNAEHAGKIFENAQNLDIAPTLLNYVGIPKPDWMPGESLLTPLDPNRPIFLAAIPDSNKDAETGKVTYPKPVPPFYQFGKMTVILCSHYYQVNFLKEKMIDSEVAGYSGKCQNTAVDQKTALQLIIGHLEEYGFNASSLEEIKTK